MMVVLVCRAFMLHAVEYCTTLSNTGLSLFQHMARSCLLFVVSAILMLPSIQDPLNNVKHSHTISDSNLNFIQTSHSYVRMHINLGPRFTYVVTTYG